MILILAILFKIAFSKSNTIVNSAKRYRYVSSKNDPDYIFEEYKGYTIASHKENVVGKDIDNVIIVYKSDEFPNNGFIIGLDDSKLSGRRKSVPNNIDDAKAYIDWSIKLREEKTKNVKPDIPKPQRTKGRKI